MSKVWFKQDDKFFLPKACLNFEFFRYLVLTRRSSHVLAMTRMTKQISLVLMHIKHNW